MAAVTSAVIGAGVSAYQIGKGLHDEKVAQAKLDQYDRQPLDNAFEDIPISTIGADYAREQSDINSANLTDAARNGGFRGVYSALPKIVGASNDTAQIIRANLDDQVNRRNYAIAQDKVNIRGMRENRDNANINALSSEVAAGRQDAWSGMLGLTSSALYAANNLKPADGSVPNDRLAKYDPVNPTPAGLTYPSMPPITSSPTPFYSGF